MKKPFAIAAALWLAVLAAFGQTAKLTAPKANEPWALGSPQTIAWTWSGSAKIKLVLDSQKLGKLGNIKTDLELNAGSYPWTVGALEKGQSAPAGTDYTIRIVNLSDGKELDTSPVFSITGSTQPLVKKKLTPIKGVIISHQDTSITVTKPGKGDVWIPLKNYSLQWTWTIPYESSNNDCAAKWNCNGCQVDAWLVRALAPAAAEKIVLLKGVCTLASYSKGMMTFSGSYSGIVPNLSSGSYFVRLARSDKPAFSGDSATFAVQSTLSPDTGYLGPDQGQQQVDLALSDVVFDAKGDLAMRIKNLGDEFYGACDVRFEINSIEKSPKLIRKGEFKVGVNARANEEVQIPLTEWGGFTFSTKGWDKGMFIPVNSKPFQIQVIITPFNDINPNNNWVSKKMCMIQEADVGTDYRIQLTFTPKTGIYLMKGYSNEIHEDRIQWVAKDKFAATMEVFLWNYGCIARTFDCWLYVDDLPGQRVAQGITLAPGQRSEWKQAVVIKVPQRCGGHRLLFIADPKERDNEPYPNSYQNNFINAVLKILCGGTIEGHL